MKSKIGRITLIVLGTLFVLFVVFGFFARFGMHSYNYPFRSGMMGSWGYMQPFGFFGAGLMWLIPIGVIVLVVLGIQSLFKNSNKTNQQPSQPQVSEPARVCPSCGKTAQSDWNTCPYCGTEL